MFDFQGADVVLGAGSADSVRLESTTHWVNHADGGLKQVVYSTVGRGRKMLMKMEAYLLWSTAQVVFGLKFITRITIFSVFPVYQ